MKLIGLCSASFWFRYFSAIRLPLPVKTPLRKAGKKLLAVAHSEI
jgi:hypothetical protein